MIYSMVKWIFFTNPTSSAVLEGREVEKVYTQQVPPHTILCGCWHEPAQCNVQAPQQGSGLWNLQGEGRIPKGGQNAGYVPMRTHPHQQPLVPGTLTEDTMFSTPKILKTAVGRG